MTIITIDNVIPMLEKVVAGNEDKLYVPEEEAYKYAHRDAPGCIVGHVFHNELPKLYSEIDAFENASPHYSDILGPLGHWLTPTASTLISDYEAQVSSAANAVLRRAQAIQDRGDSWEKALREAKIVFDYIKRAGKIPSDED